MASIPFLMIGGTVDAIVSYNENAADIPNKVSSGELLSIEGGSHLGFVSIAEPMLRSMANPDSLGCQAILAAVEQGNEADADFNPWLTLGTEEEGIAFDGPQPGLCTDYPLPAAIHAGRQHMITRLALLGFMETYFGETPDRRRDAKMLVSKHLQNDFIEVTKH